jgi:deazaflavin-dependent oxidoreductase (nitroreductase family)
MSEANRIGTSSVPSLIPTINPLVRRLIGAGMPFGPNVLITIRGRTTGEPHTFPIAVVSVGGRRYVQSPFGEVNWVRNLRAAGEAIVTKGGRRETVSAVEVPPEEAAVVLRDGVGRYLRFPPLRPILARFFSVRINSTHEELVVEARHHPMFELRGVEPLGRRG